jgi:glycosyltransferase involved in cell wall biosynthesis
MKKLFIFNHDLHAWKHPWNSIQLDWLSGNQDTELIQCNYVDSDDEKLGKKLKGNIALSNWADSLTIGLSKLKEKYDFKLITYFRSYEISSNFPTFIIWKNVDAVIAISDFKYKLLRDKGPTHYKDFDAKKLYFIRNPFDVEEWPWKKREHGHRLGQQAVISIKKGIGLLAELAQVMLVLDDNYRIRVMGGLGDQRAANYIRYLVSNDARLQPPYFEWYKYESDDVLQKFIASLNYVVCTSIDEGDPNYLKEAMAMGVKPVIHAFPGAYEMFPADLVATDIAGMVDMMLPEANYESERYRDGHCGDG